MEDLIKIITRAAGILRLQITPEGAAEIARRSRGTPRIANRLLKRVRDYAQVWGDGIVTEELASKSLDRLEVDPAGLDRIDQKCLLTIIQMFAGGPVGLETLAATVGEEAETIEDVVEPYLLQQGFLQRTPRGRVATPHAYEHFNIPLNNKTNNEAESYLPEESLFDLTEE